MAARGVSGCFLVRMASLLNPSGRPSPARQAGGDLLDQPAVAVWVFEGHERTVARVLRSRASHPVLRTGVVEHPGDVVEDLADLGAAGGQVGPGRVEVGRD